jgi:hypothetical protein
MYEALFSLYMFFVSDCVKVMHVFSADICIVAVCDFHGDSVVDIYKMKYKYILI